MRVLAVTNMYPSAAMPANGVFIAEQVKGLRAAGVEVQVYFVDRIDKGMSAYASMLGPVREAVRTFCPDILHVMYGGVMADRITRNVNHAPQVVTFHGSDLLGENLSGWMRKWISHYGMVCSRRAARRANGVIVVAHRLKKALPPGLRNVRVIPCGINLERFRPLNKPECQRRLNWAPGVFHVLFPAHRHNTVKRPGLAKAAVEEFNTRGGTAELHFLEGVANEEVPIWMNASDALLLTSAHEGSPTVVKEALGCGLPVVSVDVGDVAERIEGIEGCHLAAPGPGELASKLKLVQQRNRPVSAAKALSGLDLASTASELRKYYEELKAV